MLGTSILNRLVKMFLENWRTTENLGSHINKLISKKNALVFEGALQDEIFEVS